MYFLCLRVRRIFAAGSALALSSVMAPELLTCQSCNYFSKIFFLYSILFTTCNSCLFLVLVLLHIFPIFFIRGTPIIFFLSSSVSLTSPPSLEKHDSISKPSFCVPGICVIMFFFIGLSLRYKETYREIKKRLAGKGLRNYGRKYIVADN